MPNDVFKKMGLAYAKKTEAAAWTPPESIKTSTNIPNKKLVRSKTRRSSLIGKRNMKMI
jgi:hypothetical protein